MNPKIIIGIVIVIVVISCISISIYSASRSTSAPTPEQTLVQTPISAPAPPPQALALSCEQAKSEYLKDNVDVKNAGMDAWDHYTNHGKSENRKWKGSECKLPPPAQAPTQPRDSCLSTINNGICNNEIISGHYKGVMQGDGNVVVYSNNNPVWASNTNGKGQGPYRLVTQSDGNVVMYDKNNTVHWASNTNGKGQGPYRLVMQNDCNFVLYDKNNTAHWASNTNGR